MNIKHLENYLIQCSIFNEDPSWKGLKQYYKKCKSNRFTKGW